ncbi:glycosyltransferase family 2 protein [Candidatus Saccharibacteria bacterium]|nr:glycosyltransferase family 2 protein [Candidatus Saccharibacteria bacterium]
MPKNKLTLSIVIPAYNEEDYLGPCLDSIARQTIQPDEVIVVNNNSSDKTIQLTSKRKFVKLINQPRQGTAYAQKTGFKAATGDIIGRIDADTRLETDWVEKALCFFDTNPRVAAVTGKAYFYDFPFRRLSSVVHHSFYQLSQKLVTGSDILWGANMVLRSADWRSVEYKCLLGKQINEDVDLSLHLINAGKVIKRDTDLRASVSMRRGDLGLISNIIYLSAWPRTYWLNRFYWQSLFIYLVVLIVLVLGVPFYLRNALVHKAKR